jgi:hypothetical protein
MAVASLRIERLKEALNGILLLLVSPNDKRFVTTLDEIDDTTSDLLPLLLDFIAAPLKTRVILLASLRFALDVDRSPFNQWESDGGAAVYSRVYPGVKDAYPNDAVLPMASRFTTGLARLPMLYAYFAALDPDNGGTITSNASHLFSPNSPTPLIINCGKQAKSVFEFSRNLDPQTYRLFKTVAANLWAIARPIMYKRLLSTPDVTITDVSRTSGLLMAPAEEIVAAVQGTEIANLPLGPWVATVRTTPVYKAALDLLDARSGELTNALAVSALATSGPAARDISGFWASTTPVSPMVTSSISRLRELGRDTDTAMGITRVVAEDADIGGEPEISEDTADALVRTSLATREASQALTPLRAPVTFADARDVLATSSSALDVLNASNAGF